MNSMSAWAVRVKGASLGPGIRGSGAGGLGRQASRNGDEAMVLEEPNSKSPKGPVEW